MNLEEIVPFVDFTTLNTLETTSSVQKFISKAIELEQKGLAVAGVCTYSEYAGLLKSKLQNSKIASVVVLGGFPHSQVPMAIKLEEIKLAISEGVDEIDIVVSQHLAHEHHFEKLANEIGSIRQASKGKILKLILETGLFQDLDLLRKVSEIACREGVDFLKTSTGKISEGATPEKFEVLCEVVANHKKSSGRMTGIKASGGIRTVEDAKIYIDLFIKHLDRENLTPNYFRIGASSLLNNL